MAMACTTHCTWRRASTHDIGIARRLGYTVCWIERRKGLPGFGGTQEVSQLTKPDYHFSTLAELADAADAGKLGC